jgi:hypothetical protein
MAADAGRTWTGVASPVAADACTRADVCKHSTVLPDLMSAKGLTTVIDASK